jgi:hypothetical protein
MYVVKQKMQKLDKIYNAGTGAGSGAIMRPGWSALRAVS